MRSYEDIEWRWCWLSKIDPNSRIQKDSIFHSFFSLLPRKQCLFMKYPLSEWILFSFLTTISFLSSSISSSSLSSSPSTFPLCLHHIFPTYLQDAMHWQLLRIYQKNLTFLFICPLPTFPIAFNSSSIFISSTCLSNRYLLWSFTPPFDKSFSPWLWNNVICT